MSHACANCGTATERKCNKCSDAPTYLDDIPQPTYYCSQKCRKQDRTNHIQRCKILQGRKMIHRGAQIMQDMWITIRSRTFELAVDSVDDAKEDFYLIHEAYESPDLPQSYIKKPPMHNGSDTEYDMKTLMFNSCTSSIMTMGSIITGILQDTVKDISECHFIPSNRELWGYFVSNNGMMPKTFDDQETHEAFRITVKSADEEYVLDLTQAQYGHWDEPLMPWKTYCATRIAKKPDHQPCILDQQALGGTKSACDEKKPGEDLPFVEARRILRLETEKVTQNFVETFGTKHDGWQEILVSADVAAYEALRVQARQSFASDMDSLIKTIRSKEQFEWSLSPQKKVDMFKENDLARFVKVQTWGTDNRGRNYDRVIAQIQEQVKRDRELWIRSEAQE